MSNDTRTIKPGTYFVKLCEHTKEWNVSIVRPGPFTHIYTEESYPSEQVANSRAKELNIGKTDPTRRR